MIELSFRKFIQEGYSDNYSLAYDNIGQGYDFRSDINPKYTTRTQPTTFKISNGKKIDYNKERRERLSAS